MKCDKRFTKDSDMEVFLLNAENASVWERKKERKSGGKFSLKVLQVIPESNGNEDLLG